jgi:hypothetical protein
MVVVVAAVAAGQGVGAAAAVEGVVAEAAAEVVGVAVAGEAVGVRRADEVLDADQGVAAGAVAVPLARLAVTPRRR